MRYSSEEIVGYDKHQGEIILSNEDIIHCFLPVAESYNPFSGCTIKKR
jgi:hypothetical protein